MQDFIHSLALVGALVGTLSLSACSASSDGGGVDAVGAGGKPTPSASFGGAANPMGGTGPGGGAGAENHPSGGASNTNGGASGTNGGASNTNGGAAPAGGTLGSGGDVATGSGGTGPRIFDAGQDPARNQAQGGQVCERIASIQCAGEAFCCDAPGRTQAECKATMKQGCINSLYLDAITADAKTGYDIANAQTIFAEYERLASACDQSVIAWGASVQGLRGLTKGTLRTGASCLPSPISTDKAVVAPYLAACLNPETTACYPVLATWTCSPRTGAGSKCFADTNCNDGLYCDNPNFALSGGTCKQRKAHASPCKLLNECASLLCKRGTCAPLNQQNAFCLRDG